jgi:hypothetical protein
MFMGVKVGLLLNGRTQMEGVYEQNAEQNVSNNDRRSTTRRETLINRGICCTREKDKHCTDYDISAGKSDGKRANQCSATSVP